MSNPYETAKSRNASVLGPTLKFKGELTAEEDLLIQGQVEGSIRHTSNLTVGSEGKVKADIRAEYISVEGAVKGDLTSSQSVTVHESANIEGNIYSPTVSLLEGATFNGKIDMTGKSRADAKPESGQKTAADARSETDGDGEQAAQKKQARTQKSASAA